MKDKFLSSITLSGYPVLLQRTLSTSQSVLLTFLVLQRKALCLSTSAKLIKPMAIRGGRDA